jgi:hypothetical protein
MDDIYMWPTTPFSWILDLLNSVYDLAVQIEWMAGQMTGWPAIEAEPDPVSEWDQAFWDFCQDIEARELALM